MICDTLVAQHPSGKHVESSLHRSIQRLRRRFFSQMRQVDRDELDAAARECLAQRAQELVIITV